MRGSEEIYTEVAILYKQGKTTTDIGDMYGVAPFTVNRWLRRNGVELRGLGRRKESVTHKKCRKCKERKPLPELKINNRYSSGRETICKKCHNDEKRKAVPATALNLGITEVEYNRITQEQNNSCAVCATKQQGRRLHLDHDHNTGVVRGLLCGHCNRAMERVDNVHGWGVKAEEYVKRYKSG